MPTSHPDLLWGGVQVPKPFLTIPHARHKPEPYTVTEGWSYAAERANSWPGLPKSCGLIVQQKRANLYARRRLGGAHLSIVAYRD